MTTSTIALAELAEKGADVDVLRQMVQFMAQRLMEIDVEGRCGAGYDEKSAERINSRNGYRERTWETTKAAHEQWRVVADQSRAWMPKLSKLMDGAVHEVLSYMEFPRAHWLQIHSTNPLERLNAEIKRRTSAVGIFPNDAAITRLVGATPPEQNDEWSLNRSYTQLEGLQSLSDTAPARAPGIQR